MDGFNKLVILVAATHAMELIKNDETYAMVFESVGDHLFLDYSHGCLEHIEINAKYNEQSGFALSS